MGCGCRGSGANVNPREGRDGVTKTILHEPRRRATDPSAPDSVWTGGKPAQLKPEPAAR
jgi:hypothetical protein